MNSRRRLRSRVSRRGHDDHDHMERLYEAHAGSITAYALRRASGADAADVVADTFMVAWRRHDEIPDEPNTLPWLYGVARRVLANQRRSRRRRGALHERLRDEFVEFEASPDRTEVAEHFQCVADALAKLSNDDAELLRLTAWEGLGPTEIATTLGVDAATVRQRLRRARVRLNKQLDTAGPSAAPPIDAGRGSLRSTQMSAATAPDTDWSRWGQQ